MNPNSPGVNPENRQSPRHAAARELAAAGIGVFPCLVGAKEPATDNGFEPATTDIDQIDRWWKASDYNVGVVPGTGGLCVIDADLYKGVAAEVLDSLPPTRMHLTPSGGRHYIYATREKFGNHKLAKNVDVRSANGYVLWPPSYVVDTEDPRRTGSYTVADNSAPIAPLSADLETRLHRKREDAERVSVVDDGTDAMPTEAASYCLQIACTEHPGRYQLAAALVRNFGLSDATATELCEAYGLRTSPNRSGTPWLAVLKHARKYGQGELGGGPAWEDPRTGLPPFDPSCFVRPEQQAVSAQAASARRWPRRRPSEVKDQPPMTWLDADNLFPTGPRIMVVYAGQGNLKTQFVMSKALEVIGRTDGKVIYIAAEDGHGVETIRLPAYVEKLGLDWQPLDEHWWPISEPIDLVRDAPSWIAEVHAEGFKPDMVVIDVMTACTGQLDINSPTDGNKLMNAAQLIANAFNTLVVLLTHPGKDLDRGPVGSYAYEARADVELELSRRKDHLAVAVKKMKNGGPAGHILRFVVEEGCDGPPLVGGRLRPEFKPDLSDRVPAFVTSALQILSAHKSGMPELSTKRLAELIVNSAAGNERDGFAGVPDLERHLREAAAAGLLGPYAFKHGTAKDARWMFRAAPVGHAWGLTGKLM